MDVLKYLFLNRCEITPDTIEYAVKGGNEPVIEFLSSHGCDFNNQAELAVISHHNKIAIWIMENYQNKEIDLPLCICYFNTDILLYFVYCLNRSFNERDFYKEKFLQFATEHDNKILCDYIASQYE